MENVEGTADVDPSNLTGKEALREHEPSTELSEEQQSALSRQHAYEALPVDKLPAVRRDLAHEGAVSLGFDEAFIALPALSVRASAIGDDRVVVVKNGWEEPSVLWTAVVAKSGGMKSPAIALALEPLQEAQDANFHALEAAWKEYELRLGEWKRTEHPCPHRRRRSL